MKEIIQKEREQNRELVKRIIYSHKRIKLFRELPVEKQAEVIIKLHYNVIKKIIVKLSDKEIVGFLKFLDLDEATDILQILEKKHAKKIISQLERETKEKIQLLLRFDKESAAGLMTLDYIQVDESSTIKKIIQLATKHEKVTGKFPTILVTKNNLLLGEIQQHTLFRLNPDKKINQSYKKIPTVYYNQDFEDLPQLLNEHPHEKIVVLDNENSILGLIYSHDILRLMGEADYLTKFAGVREEEDVYDGFFRKVKNRYLWLIINLFTVFLAASVVGLFEETISKFVLLAIYLPIVAGMGGNAGTQTLAVFVRGIALNEIELNIRAIKAIVNEMLAGATNGIITGILGALVAIFWNKSPIIGLILTIAMITNLIIAGLFGAIVPLVMKKLGKDPATSATIFITTATDVLGFFVFLGLAKLLL